MELFIIYIAFMIAEIAKGLSYIIVYNIFAFVFVFILLTILFEIMSCFMRFLYYKIRK